jgi:cytidylate kinase
MDGRDIGTVVFPNADYKFFITASAQVRAQRRYEELKAKGEQVDFEDVLHNIEQRDLIDTTRSESPLSQASDAIVFDTTNVTREEQLQWILNKFNNRRNDPKSGFVLGK